MKTPIPITALDALTLARSHGISPSCLHLLLVLLQDSPLSRTEIANRVGTSLANCTALVDRLVNSKWVQPAPLTQVLDRRKRIVMPTEIAYELFAAHTS